VRETKRERVEAKLAKMCARLYDSATPARERSDLSLEVSFLRAQLGVSLDAMQAASVEEESDS
jgi:hypothetical protein